MTSRACAVPAKPGGAEGERAKHHSLPQSVHAVDQGRLSAGTGGTTIQSEEEHL